MIVNVVNVLSIYLLTGLSLMYQWLYKIVYMSIYRVYLKSIKKKKGIRKIEREYGIVLTADKYRLTLMGQWFAVSMLILTKVLTTDKWLYDGVKNLRKQASYTQGKNRRESLPYTHQCVAI